MDASVSSKSISSTFEADVRGIVGAQYTRAAAVTDAIGGARPGIVVEPGSEQELAGVLKLASAASLAVVPRGGGTKQEWGNRLARADVILSTARLNRVIEHAWADLTASVDNGWHSMRCGRNAPRWAACCQRMTAARYACVSGRCAIW